MEEARVRGRALYRFAIVASSDSGRYTDAGQRTSMFPLPANSDYSHPMRLLVVDDDLEVLSLLQRALERDRHQVVAVGTVEQARTALAEQVIDVIVLDLALPDVNGVELCQELVRGRSTIPVLVLTAHSDVSERVRALNAGADDFLAKPFAVAELRARVRALGRRQGATKALSFVEQDGVTIDFQTRRGRRHDAPISFTAREWLILEILAARPNELVRRAELLSRGWGDVTEASAASLEVLIGRIRRKLGIDVIRTIRGEGYTLEVAVAGRK